MTTDSQPGRAPAQPDDLRNYGAGAITGQIVNALKTGWNYPALLKQSLRTGTGTGLSSLDGTDGLILSGGANAGLAFADRSAVNALTYGLWRRVGTNLILSSDAGDLLTIGASTGQLAQNAYAAVTYTNGWADFGAPYAAVGYRLTVATNKVELRGMMASGTVGLAAFTLPAGFRPLSQMRLPVASNGAYGELQITTAGVVTPVVGSNVYMSLDGVRFDLA